MENPQSSWISHEHVDRFVAVSKLETIFLKDHPRNILLRAFYKIQNLENHVDLGFESEDRLEPLEMENFYLKDVESEHLEANANGKIEAVHFFVEKIHSAFWKKMRRSLLNLVLYNANCVFVKSLKKSRVTIYWACKWGRVEAEEFLLNIGVCLNGAGAWLMSYI